MKRKMSRTLDIGCGENKVKGAFGIDKFALPEVDKRVDLDKKKWPLPNNYFEKIYATHILEHVEDLENAMENIWRVGKNGCKVFIKSPYFTNPCALTRPQHKQVFNYETFELFCNDEPVGNKYYTKCNFKLIKRKIKFWKWYFLIEWIANRNYMLYEWTPLRGFPGTELQIELEVVK